MPNKNTFEILPIRELIDKYVKHSSVIVDPFANKSKIGTLTNDINPIFETDYCLDAVTFLARIETEAVDMVLYDPPYSILKPQSSIKVLVKIN